MLKGEYMKTGSTIVIMGGIALAIYLAMAGLTRCWPVRRRR